MPSLVHSEDGGDRIILCMQSFGDVQRTSFTGSNEQSLNLEGYQAII
jgi:hypothetical protein